MKLRITKKIIYGENHRLRPRFDVERGLWYMPDRSRNPQVRKAMTRLIKYYKQ